LREDHNSSSPDDAIGRGGHSRGNSSEMSSPQLHLKKKMNQKAKGPKAVKPPASEHEMELFNSIVKDYNKQITAHPRDFNADLPIL
jgi:hypothetical protein